MSKQPFFPNNSLLAWFAANKRDLPWRDQPVPYHVWVSEVMLQQTRVAVVIEYFERWMAAFPDIESLASAPVEQVIKMWEGLGYYARARNLHAGAKQCVAQFNGILPGSEKELLTIKGIGPYTVAAILNFAFRKRKAVIDGNVLRVLSRFFAIEESVDLPATRKAIEERIDSFLPKERHWEVSEAIMELGALVCGKEPKCTSCPLQKSCAAKKRGLERLLPVKKKRKEIICLTRQVAIVSAEGKIALRKGKRGEVMADLYEFPYDEVSSDWEYIAPFTTTKHHFTHYRVTLEAHLYKTMKREERWIWVDKDRLLTLPFSSGHRRIVEKLCENTTH